MDLISKAPWLGEIDENIRPQDDLYLRLNGKWLAEYVIPEDRASDGAFRDLAEKSLENCKAICEEAVKGQLVELPEDFCSAEQAEKSALWISQIYQDYQDLDTLNRLGVSPLYALLQEIAQVKTHTELAALSAKLDVLGVNTWVGCYIGVDVDNPERYIPHFSQSGLSLPDESYYREEAFAPIREAFIEHVNQLAQLSGLQQSGPQLESSQGAEAISELGLTVSGEQILALETKLAALHWDSVKCRDAEATHNPTTFNNLATSNPDFPFTTWANALGLDFENCDDIDVNMPDYFQKMAVLWAQTPLEELQNYFAYQLLSANSGILSEDIQECAFAFYGTILSGTQARSPLWKRAVGKVEGNMGQALGMYYVNRHFPASYRQQMEKLVENLLLAYREAITELDWMSQETKAKALEKLSLFRYKIGYPSRWQAHPELPVPQAGHLYDSLASLRTYQANFHLSRNYGQVDREEWHMSPQTVNAYYSPATNEIVFPAAILQDPFFSPNADEAINYGAIGAVIGHEIGHGFDDQGSHYDGHGRLQEWWNDQDREEFTKRTQALISQYNQYTPRVIAQNNGSETVNGALTIGENIGDLGGLSIAYRAWQLSRKEKGLSYWAKPTEIGTELDANLEKDTDNKHAASSEKSPLDKTELEPALAPASPANLSNVPSDLQQDSQLFFYAWARVWKTAIRLEAAKQLLVIDPHSPAEFRCNGVVRNMDIFHEVFATQPGDKLWLDPQERVRIWE